MNTDTTGTPLHIPFAYSLEAWLAEQTLEIPPRRRSRTTTKPAVKSACGPHPMPATVRAARVLEAQPRL